MAQPPALFEYAVRLGDDALILSQRISEWCGHAPVLEVDLSLANVALDLLGQAMAFLGYAGAIENNGRDADKLSPPVYGKKDRLPQTRPVN